MYSGNPRFLEGEKGGDTLSLFDMLTKGFNSSPRLKPGAFLHPLEPRICKSQIKNRRLVTNAASHFPASPGPHETAVAA
jgi:hypothetical protein